jgi:hypothetical protein
MHKFTHFALAFATAFCMVLSIVAPVSAADVLDPCSKGYATNCPNNSTTAFEGKVGDFIGYAFTAVGAISVIFIIIGGISFATSGGSPDKVKKAKFTVLFAVIGLALAISANIITSLVITTPTTTFK